ncbi:MAG TPA: AI-2E family transporter, partial [Patescibacteria group bacterium]|nr:AI-2E family transporter [Patescibacteria group bacterium]
MFGFGRKNKPGSVEITIANTTVIKVLILVILSFIFVAAFKKAGHAFILIFTAFFLALALNVPVHWLSLRLPGKRKGDRKLATTLSFLIIIGLLIGFIASIAPPLVRQTSNFIDVAPRLVADAHDENSGVGQFIRKHHLENQTNKLSNQLGDRLKNLGGTAVSGFSRVTSSIFSVLTILVLTFMMLIEGPRWVAFSRRLVPDEKEPHLEQIARDMYRVVTGFVNGQVTLAALAATLILVPLFAFHVSYPIALMVIVFICGLIPLVGHSIGAIIVGTVALFHSPYSAVGMVVYYVLYQQIENYVLQPKIQANSTNMS